MAATLETIRLDHGRFVKIWDDRNTGARPKAVQVFVPIAPEGYRILGHVLEPVRVGAQNYTDVLSPEYMRRVFVVKENSSLLSPPVDYEEVWNSHGCSHEPLLGHISFWKPIPKPGFVALGHIAAQEKPGPNAVRCVHESVVVQGAIERELWINRCTGWRAGYCTLWNVISPTHDADMGSSSLAMGFFIANNAYAVPKVPVYCVRKSALLVQVMERTDFGDVEVESKPTSVEDMRHLTQVTYFDVDELLLLYGQFQQHSENNVVQRSKFKTLFPGVAAADDIICSVFDAIDKDRSGAITFREWAVAMSMMARGSVEDKMVYAFSICDLDNNGFVSHDEVLTISRHLDMVTSKLGVSKSNYQSPDEVVDNLFKKRKDLQAAQKLQQQQLQHQQLNRPPTSAVKSHPETEQRHLLAGSSLKVAAAVTKVFAGEAYYPENVLKNDAEAALFDDVDADELAQDPTSHSTADVPDAAATATATQAANDALSTLGAAAATASSCLELSLSEEEFRARAAVDPEFTECFGLFRFLYQHIVAPIEQKLYGDQLLVSSMQGWLRKLKGSVSMLRPYDRRWFVIRGGFMAYYLDQKSEHPQNVVSLCGATVRVGAEDDGTFFIFSPQFNRQIVAENKTERQKWVSCIRQNTQARFRYQSFARIRRGINCQHFINGSEYFNALIPKIQRAQRRIFVADWYFSPGLLLDRTLPHSKHNRIDQLLLEAAERGVKVYLLVWRAPTVGFFLDAAYVTDYMSNLHPNITALSHPGWTPVIWSHHQKFVVIDDVLAFVGGIDLCFNRYEDSSYEILDLLESKFPGRDYSNLNYAGEYNGPTHDQVLDRKIYPRMPWHDIHMQADGEAALDVAINFMQRWNHAAKSMKKSTSYLLMPWDLSAEPTCLVEGKAPVKARMARLGELATAHLAHGQYRQELATDKASAQPSTPVSGEELASHLFADGESRGYPNLLCQVVRSVSQWSAGTSSRESSIYLAYLTLIRTAQHFIYIENQYFISSVSASYPRNRIAKAIYLRIRRAILEKQTFRVVVVLPVFPAGDLTSATTRYIIKNVYRGIDRDEQSIISLLRAEFPDADPKQYITFYALRRYDFLTSAQHSGRGRQGAPARGLPVTEQVYVHAKLMIVDDRTVLIGSANINDRSMLGNRDSEIAIVTTQDPSHMIDGMMNGEPYKVSAFAHDLRRRSWAEFIGLSKAEESLVADPVIQSCYWDLWYQRAVKNTECFKAVFPRIPSNARTVEQAVGKNELDRMAVNVEHVKKLEEIKGFLICFPENFLIDEAVMHPTAADKEFLLPRVTFL